MIEKKTHRKISLSVNTHPDMALGCFAPNPARISVYDNRKNETYSTCRQHTYLTYHNPSTRIFDFDVLQSQFNGLSLRAGS